MTTLFINGNKPSPTASPWANMRALNPAAVLTAKSELSKVGQSFDYPEDEQSRSGFVKFKADCRRGINALKTEAEKALQKNDNEHFDDLSLGIEVLATYLKAADQRVDMLDEVARFANGQTSGDTAKVLNKGERFADHVGDRHGSENIGFGSFIRGMVGLPVAPNIRDALGESSDSTGGYLVPATVLGDIVDKMRAKTACIQAGAQTVPLDSAKVTLARIASDPQAGWRMEKAAVAVGDPTFDGIVFQARSLAVLVRASRELLEDSMNLDQALTTAFAGAMAAELDRVCLIGTGTAPEPLGIVHAAGVQTVDMGTNGLPFTSYAPILDAVLKLKQANAAEPTAAVMAPRTWRQIAGLTDSTGQPLNPPRALENLPLLDTTNLPINLTHGTATDASPVVVGDFTQLMIGIRTQLRIEVLREKFVDTLEYGFLVHLRADVALAQPSAFAVIEGVTAA